MKIELWTKDCYGCERNGRYTAIRQYIIDNGIPLKNFSVKRIQLDPNWTKEALASDVELPLIRFEEDNGGVKMVNYDEWLRQRQKPQIIDVARKRRAKKTNKKTIAIKKDDVITAGGEDGADAR